MHKKFLTAAIVAALSVSATSVFASPTVSGDARMLYETSDSQNSLTNRIRLNVDSAIDETFSVHGRLVLDNNTKTGTSALSADQIYLGTKLGGADLLLGRQPIYLAKGLLADNDMSGAGLITKLDGANLAAYYGKKDNVDVKAFNLSTSYGDLNLGYSYLDKGTKAWAINGDTKLSNDAVLNVEYLNNTTNNATGYMAGVTFGKAVKKGDLNYTVSYRDIDAGVIDAAYTTDANYADSKGVKVEANYKVSDNTNLNVYHDFVKNQANVDKNLTHVEFTLNF